MGLVWFGWVLLEKKKLRKKERKNQRWRLEKDEKNVILSKIDNKEDES